MLQDVVYEAGKVILDMRKCSVRTKGESDFVTQADMTIHQLLNERLRKIIPGSVVVSEEDAKPSDVRSGYVWIIDPVDGTSNLVFNLHLSCVSVGLLYNGVPQEGAVYNPYLNEMFYAKRGEGAKLNGQSVSVSRIDDWHQAYIGFEAGPGSKHTPQRIERMFSGCYTGSNGVRMLGSAALDLAYVACGRFTAAYFDYVYPWDYAAGALILQEAGGVMTDFQGGLPDYTTRKGYIASNGLIQKQLLALLSDETARRPEQECAVGTR